jgi:FkbM family methyltransferase
MIETCMEKKMLNLNPTNKNKVDEFTYVLDSFYLWTDPADMHVGKACREKGFWEPHVTKWMIDNIKPGFKCLDIGFNIGYHTEILSRLSGPTGEVWAFEPNVELINNYNRAKELNDYSDCSKITVFPFGLSNKSETTNLMGPLENVGGSGVTNESEAPEGYFVKKIEIKRLDEVLDEDIDFIKIDVEGHEPLAWEGFSEKVLNCPLIAAELGPYHPEEFLKSIEEKYTMQTMNGSIITANFIKNSPGYLDVVLRKKNV